MVQAVLQASVGHKVLYTGLAQSPAHQVQMARSAHKCSVLGDRNSGLHRACWVGWSKAVRNGHTCFCMGCNFARVATKVRNVSHLSC